MRFRRDDGFGETGGWRVETVALLASVVFALTCNTLFWQNTLAGYALGAPKTWLLIGGLFIVLVSIHFLILGLLLTRWTLKPVLALLIVVTAFAVHFMQRYHVYLDPSMLRNVLATDVREAGDLMTWSLLPHLALYAGLPLWLLWRVRIKPARNLPRATGFRLLTMLLAGLAAAGAIVASYQDLASLMRNNKELRYLITPGNYLYSLARVAGGKAQAAEAVRQVVGADARPGATWAAGKKPVVMVMVLGETVRAANWGLSGYARQTTPLLAAAGVLNFADVSSCGTNTETSVPCIFSPWGRRGYDQSRIENSESLLDVVARTGMKVVWIDNQSGCKGVCRGVELRKPDPAKAPELCPNGECLDGALIPALEQVMSENSGNLLVVLHQMGNHGPAYYKRYPKEFKAYEPACEDADLAHCTSEQIVNAYDNAIRYTDHVLAGVREALQRQGTHQAAMLYVSDHGESLGENGLFLHGIPYAIAPEVQTKVPMVMWMSSGFTETVKLDATCLSEQAKQPKSHDYLFHTLLGLLDIQTSVYEPAMDFSKGCRA